MSPALKQDAVLYCRELGLDPYEPVWGYWVHGLQRTWTTAERWSWYVNLTLGPRDVPPRRRPGALSQTFLPNPRKNP